MAYHQLPGTNQHQSMLINKILQQESQLAQQQKTIDDLSSVACSNVIFSIKDFCHDEIYTSSIIEFFGRSLQVTFAPDITSHPHHYLALQCCCDLPTRIRALVCCLHQSDNQRAGSSAKSTTLLVQKRANNLYIPPSSNEFLPGFKWKMDKFVNTEDIITYSTPLKSFIVSVKISIVM